MWPADFPVLFSWIAMFGLTVCHFVWRRVYFYHCLCRYPIWNSKLISFWHGSEITKLHRIDEWILATFTHHINKTSNISVQKCAEILISVYFFLWMTLQQCISFDFFPKPVCVWEFFVFRRKYAENNFCIMNFNRFTNYVNFQAYTNTIA